MRKIIVADEIKEATPGVPVKIGSVSPVASQDTVSPLIPLTGVDFTGEFNLSTNYEVEYNEYTLNTGLTPTISSTPLINAIAGVIIKAGASASLPTTNMGVSWPGNDTFTANKSNFVAVMQKNRIRFLLQGYGTLLKF